MEPPTILPSVGPRKSLACSVPLSNPGTPRAAASAPAHAGMQALGLTGWEAASNGE